MRRTITAKLLFGLILLKVFSVQAASSSNSSIFFSKGTVAFSEGDFNKALVFFKEAYKTDSKNVDNVYFLSLTYLRLNDFSKASKYLKELLDQNPEFSQAYFDYGFSLQRQNKFSEALGWFEKARERDPNNPFPLFFIGTTQYYLGNADQALQTFEQVRKLFPKSEVVEGAKLWVEKIESGAVPGEKPFGTEKPKKWYLRAAASFFYDSNVTLDPDDLNLTDFQNNQDDIMGSGAVDLKYLLYKTRPSKLFVEYSGYQSIYGGLNFDMDRFDYGRHKGGVRFEHRINDDLQWRALINGSFYTLGRTKYLMSGEAESSFDLAWKTNWLTIFAAKFRRDDFFATPRNDSQIRDASKPSAGVEQYFFFPKNRNQYLKVGYWFDWNFAKGNDWVYKLHRAVFSFNTPLIWEVNLLVLGDFGILRKFDKGDSVFSVRRGDFIVNGTGMVSRDIIPHLNLALSYTYSMSDSNISTYTYHRHIAGLTLSTVF